jgi:DNA helicase-2/ATP-dependent DNA helicase PcrA
MSQQLFNAEPNNNIILSSLNPEQRKAVVTIDGPVLIIAGAGSGKTKALTHRIAYLVQNGVNPSSILALTFTNKAAKEMKDRIAKLVTLDASYKIWAGTFHSIFARILRYEAEQLGYGTSFSIYDQDDSLAAIRSIMNTMQLSQQQFPAQGVRGRISWAKNQMISWQEYSTSADSALEKQTALIFEQYQNKLFHSNAMDFDDLLNNMIKVLKNSPETLERYQNRFKYILVDEYQDTNKAQFISVSLLAQKYKNICVVGDDAQSIYRWRGAEIKNILDFQRDYPTAEVIKLEQNYRSTKIIISAADSVIKRNKQQLKKTLWTDNPEGDLIEVLNCYDDKEEADKIARKIASLAKSNDYEAKDFAVLYRTNAQSLALENALRRYNIKYVIFGGLSFYKRKEIKDIIAYFRLLFNPKDDEALLRVVNEPPRGIGPTSIKYINAFAEDKSISLLEAFERAEENEHLQNRAKLPAKAFAEFIMKYMTIKDTIEPAQLVKDYVAETGIMQMYKEINTEETLDRWNNINQLVLDMTDFFQTTENATFDDYLQQIALVTDMDEKDMSQNQVKMMTLHSAKGLEFPVVFISGMEQGLFPLMKADQHPEELEEERRLFYVGITRAEKRLFISYAQRRLRFGEYSEQVPSKFLNEISQEFIKHDDIGQATSHTTKKPTDNKIFFDDIPKKSYYSQIPTQNKSAKEKALDNSPKRYNLTVGDTVNHSKFGKGKLLAMTGTGSNAKAVVSFYSVGKKVLMLEYAKLEKV